MTYRKNHLGLSVFLLMVSIYKIEASLLVISSSASSLVGSTVSEIASSVGRNVSNEILSQGASGRSSAPELPASSYNASVQDLIKQSEVLETESSLSSSSAEDIIAQQERYKEIQNNVQILLQNKQVWASYAKNLPFGNASRLGKMIQDLPRIENVARSSNVSTSEFQDVLKYVRSVQSFSLKLKNIKQSVLLPEDVSILNPVEFNGKEVLAGMEFPPITFAVEFLPQQRLYLFTSALNESAGSAMDSEVVSEIGRLSGLGKNLKESDRIKEIKAVCASIKKYANNIGESIAQALQEQNSAHEVAERSTKDLWETFKTKYNNIRKSRIHKSRDDKALQEVFTTNAQMKFLEMYVQGAVESLVYDMVVYSSIIKMSQNNFCNELALRYSGRGGKELLYFMIMGAALITADEMYNSEDGVISRLLAVYLAMSAKTDSGSAVFSEESLKSFAELSWYIVTGRMLTIGSEETSGLSLIGLLKKSQAVLESMIDNPEKYTQNLVEQFNLAKGAIAGITAAQAYGLNFKQGFRPFLLDLVKLSGNESNPSLQKILNDMESTGDLTTACAVQAILFDSMSTATVFAKSQWFGHATLDAIKHIGSMLPKIASADTLNEQEELHQDLPRVEQQIILSWEDVMQKKMQQIKRELAAGTMTIDQAILAVKTNTTEANGAAAGLVDAIRIQAFKELNQQFVTGEQDVNAQQTISDFNAAITNHYGEMYSDLLADLSKSVQNMNNISSADQSRIKEQFENEQKAVANMVFISQVRNYAKILSQLIVKMGAVNINKAFVGHVVSANPDIFANITSHSHAYLHGYLQGLALVAQ